MDLFLNGNKIGAQRAESITPQYHYQINLTDAKFDRNKWYPVSAYNELDILTKTLVRGLVILSFKDPYNVPWGGNGKGGQAGANVLFDFTLSNWGNRPSSFGYVLDKMYTGGAETPHAIEVRLPQLSDNLVLTLRGGAIYHLYLDYPAQITVSSNDLTLTGNEKYPVLDSPIADAHLTDLPDLLQKVKSKLGG